MTGIARFVQDKELKKSYVKRMDLAQKLPERALLNCCLNAVLTKKGRNIHSTETGGSSFQRYRILPHNLIWQHIGKRN